MARQRKQYEAETEQIRQNLIREFNDTYPDLKGAERQRERTRFLANRFYNPMSGRVRQAVGKPNSRILQDLGKQITAKIDAKVAKGHDRKQIMQAIDFILSD